MPHTVEAGGSATVRGADELFVELICADGDLLRSEFDDIIAQEWPSPPPEQRVRGCATVPGWHPLARRPEADNAVSSTPPRQAGMGRSGRERSPPASRNSNEANQKRGRPEGR